MSLHELIEQMRPYTKLTIERYPTSAALLVQGTGEGPAIHLAYTMDNMLDPIDELKRIMHLYEQLNQNLNKP